MTFNVSKARGELLKQLRSTPAPASSLGLQSYLGSPVPVLGLSAPQMRSLLRTFRRSHPDLDVAEVNALAAALWPGSTYEEKGLAISLLGAYERVLDDASWVLADRWVDEATGWGLCDSLGSGPVAGMVYANPALRRPLLQWTQAMNPWRRRSSTYALHRFVRTGELDFPLNLLERLLYDDQLWVQRAVGTWLRECWKEDRRRTEAFLRHHVQGLPKVVITVATERAPKAFREELRRDREPRAR